MDYVQHPACAAWPEQSEADVAILAADIKQHGQRVPIVIDADTETIIDGWTRYRACLAAGIRPVTEARQIDDPVAFTISMNQHRRHLDKSQLAIVAARLANFSHGGDRKSAEYRSGKSTGQDQVVNLPLVKHSLDEVSETMGVSPRQVRYAREVTTKAPALADDVAAGKVSVNAAVKQVRAAEEVSTQSGPTKDVHGDDVPDDVAEIFADIDRIKAVKLAIDACRREVGEIAETKTGAWMHRQQIEADLKNAAAAVRFAFPYCICPTCGGDKCKDCKQTGFMPKDVYDRVPSLLKRGQQG